jgi:UDP-sulfoquinovose synthase
VKSVGDRLGLTVEIDHLPDPRVEAENHHYNARHSKLTDLGLRPHLLSASLLDSLLNIAIRYRERVDSSLMAPRIDWRNPRNSRQRHLAGVSARPFEPIA